MLPAKHQISPQGNVRYIVDLDTGCWIWAMATSVPSGKYIRGYITVKNKQYIAHRWIYEQYIGKIPEKYDLHHKCENTLCVNPIHMEPKHESEHMSYHNTGIEHSIERKYKEAKGHKRKLTNNEVNELITLKNEGKTYKFLENRFGVAPGTIHRLWSKDGYASDRYEKML